MLDRSLLTSLTVNDKTVDVLEIRLIRSASNDIWGYGVGAQVIDYQLGNNMTLGVTMYGFTNQMSWLVD